MRLCETRATFTHAKKKLTRVLITSTAQNVFDDFNGNSLTLLSIDLIIICSVTIHVRNALECFVYHHGITSLSWSQWRRIYHLKIAKSRIPCCLTRRRTDVDWLPSRPSPWHAKAHRCSWTCKILSYWPCRTWERYNADLSGGGSGGRQSIIWSSSEQGKLYETWDEIRYHHIRTWTRLSFEICTRTHHIKSWCWSWFVLRILFNGLNRDPIYEATMVKWGIGYHPRWIDLFPFNVDFSPFFAHIIVKYKFPMIAGSSW